MGKGPPISDPEPKDQFTLNATLKQIIADVLPIFKKANSYLLAALALIFIVDTVFVWLQLIRPDQRIITSHIVAALIAATAAKVSLIIITAIRRLS